MHITFSAVTVCKDALCPWMCVCALVIAARSALRSETACESSFSRRSAFVAAFVHSSAMTARSSLRNLICKA